MDGDALPAPAQLQAWRAKGADRMDPVRFAFLDALATRTHAHAGAARRLLDARLSGLIAVYADDLASWTPRAAPATAAATPLCMLVADMRPRAPVEAAAVVDTMASAGRVPEVLEEARRVWIRVRTDSQVRAVLDDLPTDAGPLNSGKLVHRALHVMRDVSPGYLQHFIAYADTLSSLERLQQNLGAATAGGPDGGKPANRTRTRKRRT
jgi:hypothetical protein